MRPEEGEGLGSVTSDELREATDRFWKLRYAELESAKCLAELESYITLLRQKYSVGVGVDLGFDGVFRKKAITGG